MFAERIPGGGLGTGGRGGGSPAELDGARRFYQFSTPPPFPSSLPEEQLSSSAVFFLLSQECRASSACSCSALLHPHLILILPAHAHPSPCSSAQQGPGLPHLAANELDAKQSPSSPSSQALWGHFFINLIPLRPAVVRNSGLIPTLISTI